MVSTPNFSAYPWRRLPTLTREQARAHSLVARWIRATNVDTLARLVGVRADDIHTQVADASGHFDPHAAICNVRIHGISIDVLGSSMAVRAIAQRLLGGPEELAAPRPLTAIEQNIWTLVVATILAEKGTVTTCSTVPAKGTVTTCSTIGLDVRLGDIALAVELRIPESLELRVPPADMPAWTERVLFDLPVVLGRCSVERAALTRLAVGTVITLESPRGHRADLDLFGGNLGLSSAPGALVATVATGYVPRDMALPDARVELTVTAGTTRLSLRQLTELAPGQIIPLGRPLAGPFEVRAEGRVLGRGELVDVDGELAVRIVSLGD